MTDLSTFVAIDPARNIVASTAVAGGQAIERACTILKEIARHGRTGARLLDLTRATGLSRPTVHRMLQSLMLEGFVAQHPSRRYGLGPVLFELGMLAPAPVDDLERYRPLIQRLADQCGDTAHLMIRRGCDVVYLLRAEGAYPIRAYVISVGERLPLAASLGGIALLAAQPDGEMDDAVDAADPTNEIFRNANPAYVRSQIDFIRRHGYGWGVDVVMPGVAGLAAAVPNGNGPAYLAVSISAISARLSAERVESVHSMLLATCEAIATQVTGTSAGRKPK